MSEVGVKPRILLVDDDTGLLLVMESRLLATGRFEVVSVSRAREALARLEELNPDLIVSDIDMPGMDGGSLAAALAERGVRTPLLFLSSMLSPAESDAAGHIGGWPMLSKRMPFDKLLAAIQGSLAPADGSPQSS